MVLRPALEPWAPASLETDAVAAIRGARALCFDVAGLGGSWPISAGNAVDAYRLALQYGIVDAVLAGASTVAREGSRVGAVGVGHLWQPYAPLSWPALRESRAELEPAIAELRMEYQRQGFLSARRYPAQIVVTRGGPSSDPHDRVLDARFFRERHPDGSAMEAWILTSEAGEDRLRERARSRGLQLDERLLVCSPPGQPEEIDAARVPELLRERLDARLVEHDGGAVSLAAFLDAGAISQLHLTLMRGRSVRQILESSTRLDEGERRTIIAELAGRARLFPNSDGRIPTDWGVVQVVVEEGPDAEAVVVCLDVRARAGHVAALA